MGSSRLPAVSVLACAAETWSNVARISGLSRRAIWIACSVVMGARSLEWPLGIVCPVAETAPVETAKARRRTNRGYGCFTLNSAGGLQGTCPDAVGRVRAVTERSER